MCAIITQLFCAVVFSRVLFLFLVLSDGCFCGPSQVQKPRQLLILVNVFITFVLFLFHFVYNNDAGVC